MATKISYTEKELLARIAEGDEKAFPQNALIDPSGKIVARNLRGEDLEGKLAKIFK